MLGRLLAEEGLSVFFGGGDFGLMGHLARGVMAAGGKITGIIPEFMVEAGWAHPHVKHVVVEDMAARKRMLIRESDAVIALPGGTGTLEELSETLVSKQLGFITSPVIIVNKNGFYDDLLSFFGKMIDEQFMRPLHRRMWSVVTTAGEVPEALRNAPPWDARDAGMAKIG
jgi:uncharacterized protein (TIGR00730 family)